MFRLKDAIVFTLILSMLIQSVSAISNIEHSLTGNKVTLTYQGTPPFLINIRGDTNIGQNSGYLWAKTNSNSFSYDVGLATNPSNIFYYGVKDTGWSSTNSFVLNSDTEDNSGLVLTKKGSNLEQISKQVADNKGWLFLAVENTEPTNIREQIANIYSENKFHYLLIIGNESYIPLIDENKVLGESATRTRMILDSYYYGTMGDINTSFVTISVGRLPFSNVTDVENYYSSLNVGEGTPYTEAFPLNTGDEDDYITTWEYAKYMCLKNSSFPDLIVNRKTQKQILLEHIKSSSVILINTHGSSDRLGLINDIPPPGEFDLNRILQVSDIKNLGLTNSPIFIAIACDSAQIFGKEILKYGVGTYIGNYNEGGYESHILIESLVSGNSVGDSVKDLLNRNYLAKQSMIINSIENNISGTAIQGIQNINLKAPNDSLLGMNQRGYFGLLLYGDPSFKKKANIAYTNNNVKITQQKGEIIIDVPEATLVRVNEQNDLLCYGGKYPLDYVVNTDDKIHKILLIAEIEDIDNISRVRIFRNNIELDETATNKIIKESTFMLIKDSKNKKYLVISFYNFNYTDKLKFIITGSS